MTVIAPDAIEGAAVDAREAVDAHEAEEVRTLRIAHLYPSLLNVAGDGGNLIALTRRAGWRGIETEAVPVGPGETPDLAAFDIVLFHGGQDVEMEIVAADLQGKAASLRDAADSGVVILAVCAGLQLLGHQYVPSVGEPMEGAHVLDLETRGGPQRFMQHAAVAAEVGGETGTVVGFENHSGLTELGPGVRPFGRVIAGAGNNGVDGTEGAVRDNVIATYLHGPVLPKNPWLTDVLLRIALERKYGEPVALEPLDDDFERRAHAVAEEKAMRNRGKRTALAAARFGRPG
jgi:CobQ-like glutamine amidotransferase family enzyme